MVKGKGGDESAEGGSVHDEKQRPRMEPWGTPQEEVQKDQKVLLHLTWNERDDKYDLNWLRTKPWIPNQDERRVSKMLWSMVSKAAERSRRHRHDNCCDAIALMR